MAGVSKLKKPVQWYEGMLLLPEHFQYSDRRFEQLLSYHLNAARPYYWGVKKYKIDEALLVTGKLKFLELEAVMPDGLVVSISVDDGDDLSLDLKDCSEMLDNKPHFIHLAIPEYNVGAASSKSGLARYKSTETPAVVDENTGRGEVAISSLQPNVYLKLSATPPHHFISFPIFGVVRQENAYMQTDYIPPLLKVTLESDLGTLNQDVSKKLRNKIAFISERIHARSFGLLSQEAENIIKTLVSGILPFEAVLNSNNAHPFDLYVELCLLAGHLIPLNPGQMPPTFSAYNHNSLYESFVEVINFIVSMLDRIQEGYFVQSFDLQDRIFKLQLENAWMSNKLVIGAKAGIGMSEKDVAAWVKSAVIASDSFIESVRDKRTLGASRQIIAEAEEMKLLPAKDVVLFEVENDSSYINPNEALQIFNVSDTESSRPLEVVLFIPKHRTNKFF